MSASMPFTSFSGVLWSTSIGSGSSLHPVRACRTPHPMESLRPSSWRSETGGLNWPVSARMISTQSKWTVSDSGISWSSSMWIKPAAFAS